MKTNSQIRKAAWAQLSGNWGSAILVLFMWGLIYMGCSMATSVVTGIICAIDPAIGAIAGNFLSIVVNILVSIPLGFSFFMTFFFFVRKGEPLRVGGLFKGFSSTYYAGGICIYLLTYLFTLLWSMLFVIPGIIKGLSYSLAPYIFMENPNLSANQAIEQSMAMMKGHKTKLFLMQLGFGALIMLSALLLFIPLLWLVPYFQTTMVKFYEDVKEDYILLTGAC